MRLRTWWWRSALSVTMVVGVGFAANAQQVQHSVDRPSPYLNADYNSNYYAHLDAELNRLRNRVRALEAKETDSAAAESGAAETSRADDGGVKIIDILTKPDYKIRGRIYFDQIMNDDSKFVDRENETGFDTIRFGIGGMIFENVLYKAEVEFEGTETDYKDIYIRLQSLPVIGNIQAGHFKEPFSLEELTSSRFITFMERSLPYKAFVPKRNFGLMAFDYVAGNQNLSWSAGTFRSGSDDSPTASGSERDDAGDWVYTGRMAWLPFYDEPSGGRYLVHIGGAYSFRTTNARDAAANKEKTFATRPELGTGGGALSSTVDDDNDWHLFGGEAAIVWGPASIQGEYYHASSGGTRGHDWNGGYVQLSYFLTGEHRGYKRSSKAFDRVKPLENFFAVSTADGVCFGWGAWQPKLRWSYINLQEGTSGNRGFQDNLGAGFNWYMNPYTRLMFDYIYEDIVRTVGGPSHAQQFGMRFQVDW